MTSIYVDYELDSCSHISYVSTRINPYQTHSYCNYWYQYLSKFKWDVVSIHLTLLRWLGYLRETPGFASLPRNRFAIIDKWTISSPYIKKRQWGENIKFFLKKRCLFFAYWHFANVYLTSSWPAFWMIAWALEKEETK